ncbi:MAG: hypothetical protein QNJ97_04740 [Myxococcota bacterium]|nr:hypothetical protein [Myxococcota bacterium]
MISRAIPWVLGVGLLLPAVSSVAEGGGLGVGARFTWNNYKKPVLAYSETEGVNPGADINAFGSPNLGGEFHWRLNRQFVILASLDFGYFSHSVWPYPSENADDVLKIKNNYFSLGFLLGLKYYFWKPSPKEAVLYATIGGGKYFTSVKNNDPANYLDTDEANVEWNVIQKKAEMIGDLASPIVAQLSIGAEFFATQSFSVGADLLGIRFGFANSNVGQSASGTELDQATWSGQQSILSLYVYSALTMTFNFTGGSEGESESLEEEIVPPASEDWSESSGWETSTQPAPANNTGWSSGASSELPPPPPDAASPPKDKSKKKRKKRGKSSKSSSNLPPPPPPPGY